MAVKHSLLACHQLGDCPERKTTNAGVAKEPQPVEHFECSPEAAGRRVSLVKSPAVERHLEQ